MDLATAALLAYRLRICDGRAADQPTLTGSGLAEPTDRRCPAGLRHQTPTGGCGLAEDVESWPTGRLLSTAARLVEHSWEALLREHGVTHAGLMALHCLLAGSLSQRALSHACRVTDQTISRTLDRLDRAGFVTRASDPDDERRLLVSITASGRAVHEQLIGAQRADAMLAAAVSDPVALRTQLIELVTTLGGPDPRRHHRSASTDRPASDGRLSTG